MITFIVIEPRRRKKPFIHLFNLLFKLEEKNTLLERLHKKKKKKTDCTSSTSRHMNKKLKYKKV